MESQSNELVVERIELTQWGDVEEVMTEYLNVTCEGTLRRNDFGEQQCNMTIADFSGIKPLTCRLKQV